jgi:hypothetical protein
MNRVTEITQSRAIAYWGTTLLTAALFAVPGVLLLAHQPHFAEDLARLGYPDHFLPFLGIWKILGAIAILAPDVPRLKEWAYAGMMFDISGALVSRGVTGGDSFKIAVPLVMAAVAAASWALRPKTRRLPGPIV